MLSEDTLVLHGPIFKIRSGTSDTVLSGYFYHGLPDSLWVRYAIVPLDPIKKKQKYKKGYDILDYYNVSLYPLSKGCFNKGEKTGNWEFRSHAIIEVNDTTFKGKGKNKKVKSIEFVKSVQPFLIAQGEFKDDKEIGEWIYHSMDNEELEQVYNYDSNKLVYSSGFSAEECLLKVHTEKGWLHTKIDRPPIYIGGSPSIALHYNETLSWPKNSTFRYDNRNVWVSFTIDEFGDASNFKIEHGYGDQFDKIALDCVSTLPHKWIPAQWKGKQVKVKHHLSVGFKNKIMGTMEIDLYNYSFPPIIRF